MIKRKLLVQDNVISLLMEDDSSDKRYKIQNIALFKDKRPELSKKGAKLGPGPGHYETFS